MKTTQLEHSAHKPKTGKYPVCFLAHDIDVPQNIGSLFRIADAFAIEKIYLSGSSIVPPNKKIKKTSRSTDKYVSYSYELSPYKQLKKLKADGYTIISLEITTTSEDIREFVVSANEKICLIIGSENFGVCQELLDISDKTLHIPMLGQNSSMNVANACSIATFEIIRKFLI